MKLIPEWMQFYGGLAIAIVSAWFMLSNLARAIVSLRRSRYIWLENIFWVTLWLYGVGAGLKFAGLGPDWVRWHMSDIGFPLFAAMVFSGKVAAQFHWDQSSMSSLECAERAVRFGGVWRRGVVMGLIASFAYEVLAGTTIYVLKKRDPDSKEELGVGGFDLWDIAHYSLGALIGWTLWNMWLNRAKLWLRAAQEGAVAAEAEAKAARKAAKKTRPKKTKPGQVRRRTR